MNSSGQILNAIRAARFNDSNVHLTIVGAISDDDFGARFCQECAEENVEAKVEIIEKSSTSTVHILVSSNGDKLMITSPHTTNQFSLNFLKRNFDQFCAADLIYFGAFMLTSKEGAACLEFILDNYDSSKTKLAFNLSAVFIVERFREKIERLCYCVDFVFGNEKEAAAMGLIEGVEFGAKVIITRGSQSQGSAKKNFVHFFRNFGKKQILSKWET